MEKQKHSQQRQGLLIRSTAHHQFASEARSGVTMSSDFVLKWGSRKRMRCMKVQVRDTSKVEDNGSHVRSGPAPVLRTTARVDRRVVGSDIKYTNGTSNLYITNGGCNDYLDLRQRPSSSPRRILRNSGRPIGMGRHSDGLRGSSSPDRAGAQDKRGSTSNNNNNSSGSSRHHHSTITTNDDDNNNDRPHHDNHNFVASWETACDDKKAGGSSSGSDAVPVVWPPEFMISLTNNEKEEDFLAIKGSKLPQRPKKRVKLIQRTLNLISPGAWLCDLSLERYEVREKKVSKKRPRGLKAMGNMDSDSE